MMSDAAFNVLVISLGIFCVCYWIALIVYIFYDDLVGTKTKPTIEESAPNYTPDISKLRKPVK